MTVQAYARDLGRTIPAPLRANNWDVGLWEFTRASRPLDLDRRLGELRMPVVVHHRRRRPHRSHGAKHPAGARYSRRKTGRSAGCGVPQRMPTAFLRLYTRPGWEVRRGGPLPFSHPNESRTR